MLNETSVAAGVAVSVENVQFSSEAQNLPRKILVIGTHLASITTLAANTPVQVLSAEDAGAKAGFGSMLHRLTKQAFVGGQGVPVYLLPQAEAGGAAAATGAVNFTGSANVVAGTMYCYIANELVQVNVTAAMTAAQLATALVAAISVDKTLPVTAVVDGVTTAKVNLTAKSKGPWGNSISIAFNLRAGQALPSGVTAAVTAMTGGTGVPTIATALAGLGTGDSANEAYFTDVVHGYGQDVTTLDAISAYVETLYSNTVGRPFRALTGDTVAGSTGMSNLITLADSRKLDRANGVIAAPGSATHPAEIAAEAVGHLARVNQDRVAQHGVGIRLTADPGDKADRWTNDYDNRDIAARAGVSPTRVQNGVVVLQNVLSFYHPDNVPIASNGYRSMRNIGIVQNMLYNVRLNFEQERWQGVSIVADTTRVSSVVDREKARDVDAVLDDLVALAKEFERRAWIFDAGFTIGRLKQPGAVTIRNGGNGFNSLLPVIFSGEGGILNTKVQFDTSLAVLLN